MALNKTLESIYNHAVASNNWFELIPYPYLLFRWQCKHKDLKTVRDIARIASHRLDKHKWCYEGAYTCQEVERLIQENSFKKIT